jgi:DNA polymerase-1
VRVLLIDADVLVYRYGRVNQHAIPWDEETWSYRGDLGGAQRGINDWVEWVAKWLNASRALWFLSDPKRNWRHDLYPDYKGQRAAWNSQRVSASAGGLPPKAGPERPMLYKPLREWLISEYKAEWWDSLEGDDLLGIAATNPGIGGEKVIVSLDKDMQTVPCKLFNPEKSDEGVRTITAAEARRFHFMQTLMGDRSDNYPGCPKMGPVTAAKLLDADCSWDAVVAAYAKQGLTEDDALVQARVARLLRHGDYDRNTHEIRLWTPEEDAQ